MSIECISIVLILSLSSTFAQSCWDSPKFGTKTGYKILGNPTPTETRPNLPNCSPIHVNMVVRHGERYPSDGDAEEMLEIAKKINMAEGKTKANITFPYSSPFKVIQDSLLAPEGERQMYELGKRTRMAFLKNAFDKNYSPLYYRFHSSCRSRTQASASGLGMGLFEGTGPLGTAKAQPIAVDVVKCSDDRLTRFADNCPEYVRSVDDNDTAVEEYTKFLKGPEVEQVIVNMQNRLNVTNMTLSYDELKTLWLLCAWELSFTDSTLSEGICSLFTDADRAVIEYAEDMEDYYKDGDVYPVTGKMACELLKDIYTSLQKKANRTGEADTAYDGVFRLGHSASVGPLYTALGLFKQDPPLRADNYATNMNRTYKYGCTTPFSANLNFVLWKCDGDSEPKIQLYVNEQLTKIPCCADAATCDFKTFEDCYKSAVEECDFNKICSIMTEEPLKCGSVSLSAATSAFMLSMLAVVASSLSIM